MSQSTDLENNLQHISYDSRDIDGQSWCFISQDGKSDEFIADALRRGAGMVYTSNQSLADGQHVFYSDDLDQTTVRLASKLYNIRPKFLVGVTGTNGKSSTVDYIRQLSTLFNLKAASLGTLGLIGYQYDTQGMTTNDYITSRKIIHNLGSENFDVLAMEVSSHGIAMNRLKDLRFDFGAFTSLSQDHLDYHHTLEEYIRVKSLFFGYSEQHFINECILPQILPQLSQPIPSNTVTIGESINADARIIDIVSDVRGQSVQFIYHNQLYNFFTKILCKFQITNLLHASLILHKMCGADLRDICNKILLLTPTRGRMERVGHPDYNIFVDYAHNPQSLELVLRSMRSILPPYGELWVVFGCGGDRDRGKRAVMGHIAYSYAHKVVITDDNPRSEKPCDIRKEIAANRQFIDIADRAEAIRYALRQIKPNDILVIAGKGHEKIQIIGKNAIYFSDQDIVNEFYFS